MVKQHAVLWIEGLLGAQGHEMERSSKKRESPDGTAFLEYNERQTKTGTGADPTALCRSDNKKTFPTF